MSALAKEYAIFAKDRTVTASDGTRIAYTVVGERGTKTPIVFVNGWTCSDAYWAEIGPKLIERGHPAVFFDTRGHGESGLPRSPGIAASKLRAEDVSADRMARDVVEVMDAAGVEKAALAGHSMGVQTIVETYRVAPDRVVALLPMAGTFENPVKTFAGKPVLDSLYPVAELLFRFLPFEVLRPVMKRISSPEVGYKAVRAIKVAGPKVTAEHIAPHIMQISDVNFSVLFKMMSGLRRHSTAELLPDVAIPVLVLAGRLDVFTPPSVQEKMAELIPDAEIVWFEEGGHMLPIEEPEGIVEAVDDFLRRRVDAKVAEANRAASR